MDRLLTSLLRKIGGSLLHDLGWVVACITPMRTMEIVMLVFSSPRVLCVREMFSRPITNCFTRGSNFLKHLETLIKIFSFLFLDHSFGQTSELEAKFVFIWIFMGL